MGVNADSVIVNDRSSLQIGRLRINTQAFEVWNPRLRRGLLEARQVELGLEVMRRVLALHAPPQSLAVVVQGAEPGTVEKRIITGWDEIRDGITCRNPELAAAGARRAAGVGIGLTPAGDDFLSGVLIALWLSVVDPEQLMASIVSGAVERTSSLSAAWLRAAGQGDAGQVWHNLAKAIHQANDELALAAGHRVLAVGNTSGADALTGFVMTMELLVGFR